METLIGIHGDNREHWPDETYRKFALGRFTFVKLMTFNDIRVFQWMGQNFPQTEVVTRLYVDHFLNADGSFVSPQEFVDQQAPKIAAIMAIGYTKFELTNEPNHLVSYGGCGPDRAEDFDAWALQVILLLRNKFRTIYLIWPGLVVNPGFRSFDWLRICWRSIQACDAIAGHGYWQPAWAMLDRQWGMQPQVVHEMYPHMELWITEAGCSDPSVSKQDRIAQYKTYATEASKFGAKAVAFWMLDGTPEWEQTQNAFFDDQMCIEIGGIQSVQIGIQPPNVPLFKIGNMTVKDLRGKLVGPENYEIRPLSAIKYLVVHHSAVDVDSTAASIADYHSRVLGWPGIGYHFLVHWDGSVEYVGDVMQKRYNVASRNTEVVGICLPGDFSNCMPKVPQRRMAKALMANIQMALGWFTPIVGHREIALDSTVCPGDTLPAWKVDVVTTKP